MRKIRLKPGVAWLVTIILGLCSIAWPQGQSISFSATGDIPYGTGEIPVFEEQIEDHNKYSPSRFLIHVGDILSGSELCDEARYALVADMLKDLAVPAYIVPGDNETSDCSDPTQGMNFWLEYFSYFEQNFCGAPATEHQDVRVENFAFTMDGVLFIGINLLGGSATSKSAQQQNADWVDQQFQSNVSQVRAAVIFAQAGPGGNRSTFFNRFVQTAAAFAKPVLFLHGDGHEWILDNPWPLSNTMRLQVDNGAAEDPVEVTVTMNTSTPSTSFTYTRDPWSNHIVVNMPPCVDAGQDQAISLTDAASLQGAATDDGDPDDALTTTWSMTSGPGTVTFENASALATTATFDVEGMYVLRLTADDGELQESDEITMSVDADGTPQDPVPVISSFTPTSGPAETVVTIAGDNFAGVIEVAFNETIATSFTAIADSQISATVPAGATTGKISVTNSAGTGFSTDDFTVTAPQYTLTANIAGSGSVNLNPAGGTYDAGTVVTMTANPSSGWQFSNWSGDLNGATNPATITVDADKNVTAAFTVSGQVVHRETRTGGSSNSKTVATSTYLTGANGQLYLAAISTRPKTAANNVSGLGLTWTLVESRCSGRDLTGIEVWMAQGTPSGNGKVTVTLAVAASNAALAVSRYSGVAATNPVGHVTSGNTTGVNGTCNGGSDNNAYAFNLTTSVDGAVAYGAAAMRLRTHTPGAGFTERGEILQVGGIESNAASVAVEDKKVALASTVSVNGTFSNIVDWAVVALEIKPRHLLAVNVVGSGSVALNSPGGVYDAGTGVTLTANPASGWQFSNWSGDLTGATNPATITVDAGKNVTATFTMSGQVVHRETRTGGSSNSKTVMTSANLTGASGQLYLAAISTRPKTAISNVSGLGLTWTLVESRCSGRDLTGIEVWMAQGTPSGNGKVTATLAVAASNAVLAVSRYSGVAATNPVGHVISGNTTGVNGTCTGGSDNNAYAFNLTTSVDGAVAYGAAAMRLRTHTPGAGYTERGEILQGAGIEGNAASVAVEDQKIALASTASVNGTFSNAVDWAVVALEIKPRNLLAVDIVGSGSVALNPLGGVYDAGTVVTLTANPASGWQFSNWSGGLTGATNPATITMDADKNVTATFTMGGQVVHQEIRTGGSSNSKTVMTSANLTGANGQLYLAAISTRPKTAVSNVSGLGLTWTLVESRCSGRDLTGIEVWMAQGIPSGNGVVTATLAVAASNAAMAISRYSGVATTDPIGQVISGNTAGVNGLCFGGSDNNAYDFILTTSVDGAMAYGAAAMRQRTHTPGAGYTERGEITQVGSSTGNAAGVAVEDKSIASPLTVIVNGTFNAIVDWAAVALEIKPETGVVKSGSTGENTAQAHPTRFALEPNYPNPFNPSTVISFDLPVLSQVTLQIYNETGQLVRTLVDGEMEIGRHTVQWNGRNRSGDGVAAGVYFYRIVARDESGNTVLMQTRQMTFLK